MSEDLRKAAAAVLDWIDRTDGTMFQKTPVRRRGRVDPDASAAAEEHNEQVRAAIEHLRAAIDEKEVAR